MRFPFRRGGHRYSRKKQSDRRLMLGERDDPTRVLKYLSDRGELSMSGGKRIRRLCSAWEMHEGRPDNNKKKEAYEIGSCGSKGRGSRTMQNTAADLSGLGGQRATRVQGEGGRVLMREATGGRQKKKKGSRRNGKLEPALFKSCSREGASLGQINHNRRKQGVGGTRYKAGGGGEGG